MRARPFPLLLGLVVSGALLATACSKKERMPELDLPSTSSGGSNVVTGTDEPPPPLAWDICGEEANPVSQVPTNLYIVMDRSGSMIEPMPGSTTSRFGSATDAIQSLLQAVGHRIRYGGLAFPVGNEGCEPGAEFSAVAAGDPVNWAAAGKVGPVLDTFISLLKARSVGGGTPTAQTLEQLLPKLRKLEGRTVVLLATDGGPNCNPTSSCSQDACMLNMAGVDGCTGEVNCCTNMPEQCVDESGTVAAIAALEENGIQTYVVGLPGSEAFEPVLNAMAVAGATARDGDVNYYQVGDHDELTTQLKHIGALATTDCRQHLEADVASREKVNVWLDGIVLPAGTPDGWVFVDDRTIDLVGASCDRLMNGDILEVLVTEHCDTVFD